MNIRLDAHIQDQFRANIIPPRPAPPQAPPSPPASKGGMHRFFGGPKKTPKARPQSFAHAPPPAPPRLPENLARYLKPDGVLARAYVSFRDIARRCDTSLFESSFPLIGQKSEATAPPQALQIGEIVLQFFRLPPLPGMPPEELPQSLGECHRGLRHIRWHKSTYFEGTLTQNGGDCSVSCSFTSDEGFCFIEALVQSWRRRQLRIIGANLTAFNDVTRKPTATIDLRKAVAVEDDQEPLIDVLSPGCSRPSKVSRYMENDGLYGIGRSFRLVFNNNQEIIFYADTEEEKAEWYVLCARSRRHRTHNCMWHEIG